MSRKFLTLLAVCLTTACFIVPRVQADLTDVSGLTPAATYGFTLVSGSADTSDFSVEIYNTTSGSSNSALFRFINEADDTSKIGSVYFYDGVLLLTPAMGGSDTDGAVLFQEDFQGKSGDYEFLPGFTSPPTNAFFAASGSPTANAVGSPGHLDVEFQLANTFDVLMDMVALGTTNTDARVTGSVQVGLKAISVPWGEGSGEMVMTPLPGAALLGFLGLGYAGMKLRKHV